MLLKLSVSNEIYFPLSTIYFRHSVYFAKIIMNINKDTHRANFLVGVGELASQAKIQHVAASAGTSQSSHGKVRLQSTRVTTKLQSGHFDMTLSVISN